MTKNQSVPCAVTETSLCPCNSGRTYAECCGPLLAGDRLALSAETLMRSRYTAYVVRDIAYLLRSWHPSTRPAAIDPDAIPEWHGLHIVRTGKGMAADSEGVVEFEAISSSMQNIWRLHEASRFVKEEGRWFYVDGDIKNDPPPGGRRETKIGRNDPCHCGSGKKFKKCCGI